MMINAIFPVIEWFGYYIIRHVQRMVDQRKCWPNDVRETHCTTIGQFYQMYVGPAFLAHFKFAFVAMIVFVTLMYGLIMPILILIAWFAIFILYASETVFLHYSYSKPCTFDIKITTSTLQILNFAPSFMLLLSAYAFSNQQVFQNVVTPLD